MDKINHAKNEQEQSPQEDEGDSVPVLLAKAAALSTTIEGHAARLAAEVGRQIAGLHGMQPVAAEAAPSNIDPSVLVTQAQEAMVDAIARLRGLAEGMGIETAVAAGGEPSDPLAGLLAGLASQAQEKLGGHAVMAPIAPLPPQPDVDLKAIVASALAAHDQAQRAAHDLLSGMGLDPADPASGLALRMPSSPAVQAGVVPTDMPGGEVMGTMQADTLRLQTMLAEIFAKIVPPS